MSTRTRRAIHLILDWDGTLACKDSLQLVAKIGYDKHGLPLNGPDAYPPPATSWNAVGSKYMERYSNHKQQYRPRQQDRKTLVEEKAWLASLKPIEVFGAHAAEDTRIFSGIGLVDVQQAAAFAVDGGLVTLRPGWDDLLDHILISGSFSILSVNWSAAFIRSSILAALKHSKDSARQARLTRYVQHQLQIDANEIHGLERPEGSTGRLRRDNSREDIRTSADKLRHMPKHNQHSKPRSDDSLVVYCGDSDTDLECLLDADIGICMQDDPKGSAQETLAATLKRLDISVRPVEGLKSVSVQGPCVWTARDFHQVLVALQSSETG